MRDADARGPAERCSNCRSGPTNIDVQGSRMFNPGWHMARDDLFMLTVAEAVIRAAIERKREPGRAFPNGLSRERSEQLARVNFIVCKTEAGMRVQAACRFRRMPPELAAAARGAQVDGGTKVHVSRCSGETAAGGEEVEYGFRPCRAWWSWTPCTGSRRTWMAISRCAGTARRPNVARAARKSTGSRNSCARRGSMTYEGQWTCTCTRCARFP